MDVHLQLFCERLKRVLADEEGTLTLPDLIKTHFQNIHRDTEIITTLLKNYEADMNWILIQLLDDDVNLERKDLLGILRDINYFVNESEKVIDAFFISIMRLQQQNVDSESEVTTFMELCDPFLGIHFKIIDIRHRIQQLPPSDIDFQLDKVRDYFNQIVNSSCSEPNGRSELERGREELLDLLIEGQPWLTVVAILDSSGFDKTAFANETYNNNHVKFYFDCLAWVRVSVAYNFGRILDDIMKAVMPPSSLGEIMGTDHESKKAILRDYLRNKKYFIVLDDVWHNYMWDDLREALPEYQNGSRVLITVADPGILISLELENGEKIWSDSVLVGGPLIRIKNEGLQMFILQYGCSTLENVMRETRSLPCHFQSLSLMELPCHLKVCCLYLCAFLPGIEISTGQLYQLWIAEGLIPQNSKETAEEYLKELINKDFIQVTKRRAGGTIKECYVPSYAYVLLVCAVDIIGFLKLIEGYEEEKSWKTAKRFSIFGNLTQLISLEHSDTYLHSLLILTAESDHLALVDCEKICKKFKFLRVLNLGSLVLDEFPSGIENLLLLKYLKLHIPSLKSLPSSLCKLLYLYTLDMSSSYIDHTPDDIWKMHQLMHLNFGYITLPAHPRNHCNSLKNLSFLSALHPSSCTPDILARLPNVQTLRIYGDISNYQWELSKALCKLLKLECLKMVNDSKLRQHLPMVLDEYQFPSGLTQLSLSNTKLREDPMPILEKLPLLQVLKLKQNSYSGRKLACVGSGGFPHLKILHLKSMFWLEEWTMRGGAMPKLESLIINPCAYLKNLPEELWRIGSLCKLELHWPQPELRKRLRAFQDMERRYDIQMYPYGI